MKHLFVIFALAGALAAQDIQRPTAEFDSGSSVRCGIVTFTSTSMPKAYDAAGQSTASALTISGFATGKPTGGYRSRVFYTWAAPSGTYTALTLNVYASTTSSGSGGGSGGGEIKYSTNNGSTWTSIVSGTSWAAGTRTVTLSASQDLSQLQVSACVNTSSNGSVAGPTESMSVYDIWTSGTMSGQAPGNGSSAGKRHNAVFIN